VLLHWRHVRRLVWQHVWQHVASVKALLLANFDNDRVWDLRVALFKFYRDFPLTFVVVFTTVACRSSMCSDNDGIGSPDYRRNAISCACGSYMYVRQQSRQLGMLFIDADGKSLIQPLYGSSRANQPTA